MNTAASYSRPTVFMDSDLRRNDGKWRLHVSRGQAPTCFRVQVPTREAARPWMLNQVQHDETGEAPPLSVPGPGLRRDAAPPQLQSAAAAPRGPLCPTGTDA
jgi:hypothetical protein